MNKDTIELPDSINEDWNALAKDWGLVVAK